MYFYFLPFKRFNSHFPLFFPPSRESAVVFPDRSLARTWTCCQAKSAPGVYRLAFCKRFTKGLISLPRFKERESEPRTGLIVQIPVWDSSQSVNNKCAGKVFFELPCGGLFMPSGWIKFETITQRLRIRWMEHFVSIKRKTTSAVKFFFTL